VIKQRVEGCGSGIKLYEC